MKKYITSFLFLLGWTLCWGQVQYNLNVRPNRVDVPQQGGTYTFYAEADSIMDMSYAGCSGAAGQIASHSGTSSNFTVTFKANNEPNKSGYLYVSYNTGVGMLSASIPFTQVGVSLDYSIKASPSSLTFDGEGSGQRVNILFNQRTGPATTAFKSISGVPAWCTVNRTANAELSVSCTRNQTGNSRSATITVAYDNPLNSSRPETTSFTISQPCISQWVTLSPKSMSVPAKGGSQFYNSTFFGIDSIGGLDYSSFSDPMGQVQSANGSVIMFAPNLSNATKNGSVTLSFHSSGFPNTLWDNITYSQPPVSYNITSPGSVNLSAHGGSGSITMSYVDRTGPVTIGYQSAAGLPSWCGLTPGSNGTLNLSAGANSTLGTRSATVTVYYQNPINASQPVSRSFTVTQPAMDFSIRPQSATISVPVSGSTPIAQSVLYNNQSGGVNMPFVRFDGVPSWCTISYGGGGQISISNYQENTGYAARSATVTAVFHHPASSATPISTSFVISQAAYDYTLKSYPEMIDFPADGGSSTATVSYRNLNKPLGLVYDTHDPLPAGCSLEKIDNANFRISRTINLSSQQREGNVVLWYKGASDASFRKSVIISTSQAPLSAGSHVYPADVTVPAGGGQVDFQIAFSRIEGDSSYHAVLSTILDLPSGATFTGTGRASFSVVFPANTGTTTLSQNFRAVCVGDAPDSSPQNVSVHFTQTPLPFTFRSTQSTLAISAEGETNRWLPLEYTDRPGQNVALAGLTLSELPSWCRITANANNLPVVTCDPNTTGAARSTQATISFPDPLNSAQRVSATLTLSQPAINYTLAGPASPAQLKAEAGSDNLVDISYASRPANLKVNLTMNQPAGLPAWITAVEFLGDGKLKITCLENSGNEARSAMLTLSFQHPNGGSPLSVSFTVTQGVLDYSIKATPEFLSFAASGSSEEITISYLYLTRQFNLEYESCGNLPEGCTIQQLSNTKFRVTRSLNKSESERNGSISLTYKDPNVPSRRVSVSIGTQQGVLSSGIYLSPSEINVDQQGGTHNFEVVFRHIENDTSTFAQLHDILNLPQGATYHMQDNRINFSVTFAANTTQEALSGNLTAVCKGDWSDSPLQNLSIAYQQAPVPFDFGSTQSPVAISAEGETNRLLPLEYTDPSRKEQPVALPGLTLSELPSWCRITANANNLPVVTCDPNTTGAARSTQATISFPDPLNSAQRVSATLTLSQPAINYTLAGPASPIVLNSSQIENHTVIISYSHRPGVALNLEMTQPDNLPEWITAMSFIGDGKLQFSCSANPTPETREANLNLSFVHPTNGSSLPVALTICQNPNDYSLTSLPSSLNVSHRAEKVYFEVGYQTLKEPFSLLYQGVEGNLPAGCTEVLQISNTQFEAQFEANTNNSERSGTIRLKYAHPEQPAQTEIIEIPTLQNALEFGVYFDTYEISVAPQGSFHSLIAAILPAPDSLPTLEYVSHRGLPEDCEVSAGGSTVNINFRANTSQQTLRRTAFVTFKLHYSTGIILQEATLKYVQEPYIQASELRSVTRKSYRDKMGTSFNTSVAYYDGFNRLLQQIQLNATPQHADLVSFTQYDLMGRPDSVAYLPFVASTSGAFVEDAPSLQTQFYETAFPGEGSYARSYTRYDRSVLGFPLKQNQPGSSYGLDNGYHASFQNQAIGAEASLRHYRVEESSSLRFDGMYAQGTLWATCTLTEKPGSTDPKVQAQRRETWEYTDARGRLIAREIRISSTDRRMTYYVYDDLDRLRYIVTPAQDGVLRQGVSYSPEQVCDFGYYTEYDSQGHVTLERVPGAGYTLYLYDFWGRPAMSQTAKQGAATEWTFIKYDALNRPILTGLTTGGTAQSHQQQLLSQAERYETRGNAVHGYTNRCYPSVADSGAYLNVTYYDNYTWRQGDRHMFSPEDIFPVADPDSLQQAMNDAIVRGLSTGSKTKVLGVDTDRWITSATYYDNRYLPMQNVSDLYPDGTEITSNRSDFTGRVTRTRVRQSVSGNTCGYDKSLAYDPQGRLLSVDMQVLGNTGDPVRVAAYQYDELGRPASKHIHNGAETTSYAYDLQSRTTAALSPSFSWWLGFDQTVEKMGGRLDGNIQIALWQRPGEVKKAYQYKYDELGQMTQGAYQSQDNGVNWSFKNIFKESVIYENNGSGNIKWISRDDDAGVQTAHTLGFTGYRLKDCRTTGQSGATAYTYDANGNPTFDARRGTNITYNILNLPEDINKNSDNIHYIYTARGEKLASSANGSLTYYRRTMTYDGNNNLSYIFQPEGLISMTTAGPRFGYFKTDHLGNTRAMLVASDNGLENVQQTDYYPFGLSHENQNLHLNKNLFTGAEFQDASMENEPLGLYDFKARFYDPFIARWTKPDRLARKYHSISPYSFCGNNPVNYTDPNGDSLKLSWGAIMAILNGLGDGMTIEFTVNDRGFLDPTSFEQQAKQSGDLFLQDLYTIASHEKTVELMYSKNETFRDREGNVVSQDFGPMRDVDNSSLYDPRQLAMLRDQGIYIPTREPYGINGVALFPFGHSVSGKNSLNDNIQILINENGNLNHQTLGIAHEMGHVILYLNGLPYAHSQPGADAFINLRDDFMKKRLGYE